MTDEAEVLKAISHGEGQRQEFKRLIDNLESIAGEIVAFANSDGGSLFVGVEDNGVIAGLSDMDSVFQSLSQICRDRCIPPVSPMIETFSFDGKPIVVLTVNPIFNGLKPYRTAGGRFYIRIGRDKRDATGCSWYG
jgi:ATP-dependent DNA helicase RecG